MAKRPVALVLLSVVVLLASSISGAQADTGDIIEPQGAPPTATDGWQAATCTTDAPQCSASEPNFFTQAGAIGALSSGAFFTGSGAHDADDRIIYNPANGNIYYEADGNGAGAAMLFAHVTAEMILTNSDLEIIG